LVRNVTIDNYAKLAQPFIKAEQSRIVSRILSEDGIDTRRQWGAWLSYFLRHRITGRQGKTAWAKHGMAWLDEYMVPAEWPHLFDADETVQGDHKAGNAFVVLTKLDQRSVILVPDENLGFIARQPPKPASPLPQARFCPFPKLWEAFCDDPEVLQHLDQGLPFDTLYLIFQRFATEGATSVREKIIAAGQAEDAKWREKINREVDQKIAGQEWAFKPKKPAFDLSDFPDGPSKTWNWKDPLAEE
jgi:hypothetical protein